MLSEPAPMAVFDEVERKYYVFCSFLILVGKVAKASKLCQGLYQKLCTIRSPEGEVYHAVRTGVQWIDNTMATTLFDQPSARTR